LGPFTPSKDHKVANLNAFQFDKASGVIVQQQTKKLSVTEKYPLPMIIETTKTKDVKREPISIAYFNLSFTMESKQNHR